MDAFTHLLTGILLGTALASGDPALALLVTIFAVLPDADTISWVRPRLFPWLRHRGVTHSVISGAGFALVAAAGFAAFGLAPFHVAFAFAYAGFLSHVILDVLNWGCQALWPLHHEFVEFTVQRNLHVPAAVSSVALVVLAAAHVLAPAAWTPLAALIGGGWLAFMGFRFAMKLVVLRVHGRRACVLPTADPFKWRVVPEARRGTTGEFALRRSPRGRIHDVLASVRPAAAEPVGARRGVRERDSIARVGEGIANERTSR